MISKNVIAEDWGEIDYKLAWDRQTDIQQTIISKKLKRDPQLWSGPYHLIFCQHPKVFTLGRSGKESNLLVNDEMLNRNGIGFYKINRGGDITFHGPGQIVVYPIIDLENFFTDVHKYVRKLEATIIRVLNEYNIDAYRNPKYTGVWLTSNQDHLPKKICAIGVHMSRWVTLHGLAFNVHTDLRPYDFIVPCGIRDPDKGVTSLHLETQLPLDLIHMQSRIKHYFAEEFECDYIDHA
jgi:lipoyl(octanoyl) transferase